MDDIELARLLRAMESDRVERKASMSTDKEKISEAICAFANDLPNHRQPGVVFVGVHDDGRCAHLPIDDRLLLTLGDLKSNGNILPFPSLIVQKRVVDGCELAVILVEPSEAPPVRYKGRVWIRVGPRRGLATAEEERRLSEKRRSKDLPFDVHPVAAASLADLDNDFFREVYLPAALAPEVLEQNQRSLEQQLTSVRFATLPPNAQPTYLGILVTGNDPRQFLPGAYVQFLRLDGVEVLAPIKDAKEIVGRISEQLRMLDEIFEAHITVATDIAATATTLQHPDYPLAALQQLARNAVLHRSYENTNAPVRITWFNDRIEIQNAGGPFGQVTRANFGQPGVTDYRNPYLAEALKNLGYVQRFGFGIELARQQLQRNGNPPPEFDVEDSHVLVTVRRRP